MISKAVMGGGCFWCIEAVLQRLKGVQRVEPGYAGGKSANPSYQQVCSGKSGHAEVVRVTYNPQIIPYKDLIYIFMNSHDPTTLNRQNNDVGPQYRSIILYESEEERELIKSTIQEVQKAFKQPIVTEVAKLTDFYAAQPQHFNYYNENPGLGYCRLLIKPKIEKLEMLFAKYVA